jgi:inhibitor of cysteine peptidase
LKRFSFTAIATVLAIVMFLAQGCAQKQAPVVTGPRQQSKTVTTGPGEVFMIDLPSNKTTGYEWALTKPIDTAIVTVQGNTYIAGPAKTGVDGHQVFRFKTVGRGTTLIPLEYIQPWERNKPAKSFVITVNVTTGEVSDVKKYSDPGTPITNAVGQEFLIALEANPTTGYQWQLSKPLEPALKLEETSYSPEEGQVVGSGGTQYWRFEGVAPGTATVTLNYLKPWEKDVAPAKTESFTVNVQ